MVSAGPAVSPVGGLTVRVMFTVRKTLPVAPTAVIVIVLDPTARGMLAAIQFAPVNTAKPDEPALADHVIAGGPSSAVTVPESEIVADVVVAGTAFTVRLSNETRVTLTVWAALPVVSVAVIVMLLSPTVSGMFAAVQVVPFSEAVPEAPPVVDHVTTGVPLPPVTVPASEIVADVVVPGTAFTVRLRDETRVTLTVWEAPPVVSVAVTVMLLSPTVRGIFAAVQLVPLTEAVPDAPPVVDHVTNAVPLPPVTVPESDTIVAAVVPGVELIVRARGTVWPLAA